MERLTKRRKDGHAEPVRITQFVGQDIADRLADYEDAEEHRIDMNVRRADMDENKECHYPEMGVDEDWNGSFIIDNDGVFERVQDRKIENGKAVLVLNEMPQTCEQCQFYRRSSEPLYDAYVCEVTKSLISARSHDCKPKWCPLKELPAMESDR